jgi:hypothetical protein
VAGADGNCSCLIGLKSRPKACLEGTLSRALCNQATVKHKKTDTCEENNQYLFNNFFLRFSMYFIRMVTIYSLFSVNFVSQEYHIELSFLQGGLAFEIFRQFNFLCKKVYHKILNYKSLTTVKILTVRSYIFICIDKYLWNFAGQPLLKKSAME